MPSGTVTPAGGKSAASQGAVITRGPFSFAFNTAGLNNGVAFYTPTVGDILLEAWIEVDTAFNGTTPLADIGQFVGVTFGLFSYVNAADLSNADSTSLTPTLLAGGTAFSQGSSAFGGGSPALSAVPFQFTAPETLASLRIVPSKFTTADPMLLVVSQDGTKGGTAVGGSAGAGKVYIVTVTPVSF